MRAIGYVAAAACTAYVGAVGLTVSADRTGIGSDTVLEMIQDAPGQLLEGIRDGAAELFDLWTVPDQSTALLPVAAPVVPRGLAALSLPPAASITAPGASPLAPALGTLASPGGTPAPVAPAPGEISAPAATPTTGTGTDTPAQPDLGSAPPAEPVTETPVAPTDPGTTDLGGSTDPCTTDPGGSNDPGTTDPGPVDPEPTGSTGSGNTGGSNDDIGSELEAPAGGGSSGSGSDGSGPGPAADPEGSKPEEQPEVTASSGTGSS
jgi:hypothetical protein